MRLSRASSSLVPLLALAAVGCVAPARTAFELDAVPAGARFASSWGVEGSLPATLEPPLQVGRQWVEVSHSGFHTQRVRFEYTDRREPSPFTDRSQRLFGLERELASKTSTSDLERDLSLDFQRILVSLVPLREPPIYVVDAAFGTQTDRVVIER